MSTMSDNEPVNLEEFRRRRAMAAQAHNEACKQLSERTWQELCALWERYTDELQKLPDNPGQPLSANAVFIVLLRKLLLLPQIHRADDNLILDYLLAYVMDQYNPRGRVRKLLECAALSSLYVDEEMITEKIEAKVAHASFWRLWRSV